ncbi:hypothetical protein [Ruegeria aquimaris]|uniref:Uncharacterized protein n=1 Tax=Ruegeria aquimaris TaxID=2984333 RepID=A0ABT3AJM2_9RHOB|nr:hypothetical protein [Ruegeria sp. XHP0148]MCV2888881.1 hypothetical protein [Ruegeria sp. XHP0148]
MGKLLISGLIGGLIGFSVEFIVGFWSARNNFLPDGFWLVAIIATMMPSLLITLILYNNINKILVRYTPFVQLIASLIWGLACSIMTAVPLSFAHVPRMWMEMLPWITLHVYAILFFPIAMVFWSATVFEAPMPWKRRDQSKLGMVILIISATILVSSAVVYYLWRFVFHTLPWNSI